MIAVAQAFKDAKLGGEDTIGIAMTGTTSHNYPRKTAPMNTLMSVTPPAKAC